MAEPAPRFFNSGAMVYQREARVTPLSPAEAKIRIALWRGYADQEEANGFGRLAEVYRREADALAVAFRRAHEWARTWGGEPPCAA